MKAQNTETLAHEIAKEDARFNASAFAQRADLDDAAKAFEYPHDVQDIEAVKSRAWDALTALVERQDQECMCLLNDRTHANERITRG